MRAPIRVPLRRGSEAISPTAHYTGHVWGRNGLSPPELATVEGRLLFGVLAPAMTVSRALGGPTLDSGPRSLARVASELDRDRGLAIITEGLLTYFGEGDVLGMWRRFAREL